MRDGTGRTQRVLILGGTSEIARATLRALDLAPGASITLAGRDPRSLDEVAASLQSDVHVDIDTFDATVPCQATGVVKRAFDAGDVDVVIPAFGVLGDQAAMERDPESIVALLMVDLVSQATALLECARRMREQGHGTIVVLSSIAGVRARRANFVYGAGKAGLDALANGLTDSLHGTGVRVLIVRPGFVVGRMTAGMKPAPLATTPDAVGTAIGDAINAGREGILWVPPLLRVVAAAFRVTPRQIWRRLPR
jgi:decaprenylphospho-beta-D-erythro-pentofuranosid-2-ulose 2-reductase